MFSSIFPFNKPTVSSYSPIFDEVTAKIECMWRPMIESHVLGLVVKLPGAASLRAIEKYQPMARLCVIWFTVLKGARCATGRL